MNHEKQIYLRIDKVAGKFQLDVSVVPPDWDGACIKPEKIQATELTALVKREQVANHPISVVFYPDQEPTDKEFPGKKSTVPGKDFTDQILRPLMRDLISDYGFEGWIQPASLFALSHSNPHLQSLEKGWMILKNAEDNRSKG